MQAVELSILNWIQEHLRCAALDVFFPAFTSLANHGEIWILLAVVLLMRKKTREAGLSLGAGLAVDYVVCNLTLKPLIGRIRPFAVNPVVELLVEAPRDASFPSGHTAVSFAAVAALYGAGSPLWKPAAVVAALMAASRLYLYVHWPTDILWGIAVGWLCGWLGTKLVKCVSERSKNKQSPHSAG